MPDFTPEQIAEARANPRAGDVWDMDGKTWIRTVVRVTSRKVFFFSAFGGQVEIYDTSRKWWKTGGTRHATLVRRGDA